MAIFIKAFTVLCMSPTPEAYELHLEHLRKGVHADAPRVVNVDAEVPGWTKTVAYVEATWLVHRIKFVNAWVARHPHFGNIATSRAEGTHSTLESMLHTRPAQRRPGQGRT